MIAALVLSMRLIAGERESGTSVVLNTAPISDRQMSPPASSSPHWL